MVSPIMETCEMDSRESALSTVSWISKFQSSLPEYPVRPAAGMAYGMERKYMRWEFDKRKYKSIEILHLTDTQYGHVECQVGRIKEYIDWVLAKPNRFVLFGGDMVDAINVWSPGSPWENVCEAQGQIYQFCNLVAPLRGRILGYVGGNHERRGVKTFGDLGLLIATLLKIPYSSGRQLIDIHFGQHSPFEIDLWHGRGSASTDGSKVMMVSNYVRNHPGASLYLTGHLHDCFLFQKHREDRLPESLNVKIRKVYMGMSSSFLNTWGTYAEVAGMSITDVAMLRCILTPDGHSEMTIR